ncbi:sensor histidine kinase [Brevibacillus sp. NPDC003359]|uniref:sensor histidine kinase n=1 Tax=unclassified Brevibacillus TaxID=2684853 RepID=UPI00368E1AF7
MRKWSASLCNLIVIMVIGMLALTPFAYAMEQPPQAKQGVLDLRGVHWEDGDTIWLDGEWSFYWRQLLTPGTFQSHVSVREFMQVPSSWKQGAGDRTDISNQGYATYRLLIQLDEQKSGRPFELYMPSVATAYKLWINGKVMAENGVVGEDLAGMIPKNYPKVVVFQPDQPQVELVIHVSNFVQRKGGLWEAIELGDAEQIMRKREANIIYAGMIAASLLVMGIYHFGLYMTRKRESSTLYFCGVSIAVAVRIIFLGETMAVSLFPQIPWELVVKLEYMSSLFTLIMLACFVHSQYRALFNRFILRACVWTGLLLILFVFVTPARIYTEWLYVGEAYLLLSYSYMLFVYGRAILQKQPGSVLNGIGLLVFFAAVVNEVLFYAHLSPFENAIPFGLLVFLLTQMMNLSMVFARSFAHVEQLSEELAQTNEWLEQKVLQRTQALADKNQELQRMEESRRMLLSNISHELGTPLTSIQGFIKAMIDGVVKPHDPKYLGIIYEKTIYLHRIITDLFELSKMESRQLRFHFQPLSLVGFFRGLYEKHLLDMQEKQLQFVWEAQAEPEAVGKLLLVADPIRLEQVMSNLLVNAQAYTPPGGVIKLQVEWEMALDGTGEATIKVIDTGAGIQAEALPFVFDRFYRGSESRKLRTAGVGLGLAISKEIIDNHHGKIGVQSNKGEGSLFWFSLPIRWEEESDERGERVKWATR